MQNRAHSESPGHREDLHLPQAPSNLPSRFPHPPGRLLPKGVARRRVPWPQPKAESSLRPLTMTRRPNPGPADGHAAPPRHPRESGGPSSPAWSPAGAGMTRRWVALEFCDRIPSQPGEICVKWSARSALQETQTYPGPWLSTMANTRASPQRAQGAVGLVGSGSGGGAKASCNSPTLVVSSSKVV